MISDADITMINTKEGGEIGKQLEDSKKEGKGL